MAEVQLDRTPSIWFHGAILAVVLALSGFGVGASGRLSIDEGLGVLQAKFLSEGRGWAVDHPLEVVDPTGTAMPLRHERTDEGYVPFAKHPLYPVILAGADRIAGIGAMVAMSVAGTVLAAIAAAHLARRLDEGLAVPTLYACGLASPLLFDSSFVVAHSLAAAFVGAGALALVRHHEADRWVSRWLVVGWFSLVVVGLLRGEGPLLIAALTLVALALALKSRARAWASLAGAAVAAGLTAILVDRAWHAAIVGEDRAALSIPGYGGSLVADRLAGLVRTTLEPDYRTGGTGLVILGGAALLAVAVLALRRGGTEERAAAALAAGGAACYLVWAVSAPRSAVPGLLPAFPLLWVGLALGRWRGSGLARTLVAVSGLFALAVAATQYRQGGGYEWGARYVAIALPLFVPVAVMGAVGAWRSVTDRRVARALGASMAIVTVATATMALTTQQLLTRATDDVQDRIEREAVPSHLGPDDADGRPIVVTAEFAFPQIVWPIYDEHRWLRIRDDGPRTADGLDPRVAALYERGVDHFTFITRDPERDVVLLGPGMVTRRVHVRGSTIMQVRAPDPERDDPNRRSPVVVAR